MAEKKAEKPKPAGFHAEFGWFIWGVVILALAWFWTGGIYSEKAREGAYLKPAAPLSTGEAYGTYYSGNNSVEKTKLDLPQGPSFFIKKTVSVIEGFLFHGTTSREK